MQLYCGAPGNQTGCLIATHLDEPPPAFMLIHLDDFLYGNNGTGSGCVDCMRNFSTGSAPSKFAYACEQYCMNP